MTKHKILCVDDDFKILQGYARILRKNFDIYTAEGGEQGLSIMKSDGPFGVIVSDMRMPGMNGVEFLAKANEISPNSVRVMLTGDDGQQSAIEAVNEGRIFRFLTKPCSPETLAFTLRAGIEQYNLVIGEKQLLQETLSKSLQVMIEILALVNPTAFSRATRIKRLASDVANRLKLENVWEIELAAMLSQIGCITVPTDTLKKMANCEPLKEEELRLYQQHPRVGHDLIAKIPRMETVARIIALQNTRIVDFDQSESNSFQEKKSIEYAKILKIVLDFDKLIEFGNSPHDAFLELSIRQGWYDADNLNILKQLIDERIEEYTSLTLDVSELKVGMVLDEPLNSISGTLVLAAGQEITLSFILRTNNFAEAGIITNKVKVRVPAKRPLKDTFSLLNNEKKLTQLA